MKRNILLLLFAFLGVHLSWAQEQPLDPSNGPIITFAEDRYDFGEIEQGAVVEHVFTFENTGNVPLVLTDVKTTCGCTAPEWPREPIAPGASAELKVRFNSRGKIGVQNKTVTIYSNAQNSIERVRISTQVNRASGL
jgi:hypothetical protein